jgi:hypothetical protein
MKMKKLSLILALMLVLSCFAFAACSDDADTSSTASTSSETSKDTSKTESKTESNDSSDVTSEDASDDSSDVTSDEAADSEIEGEVISGGAAYTAQDLFRQNDQWVWDENCDPAYPDTNGTEMTDGVFAPAEAHNLWMAEMAGPWAGFHTMHPDYGTLGYSWITVDLGEATDITGVKIYSAGTPVDNAVIEGLTVFVSNDGENWEEFGAATVDNGSGATVTETAIAGTANAQYVQYRFTSTGYWMAICEVEVYGPIAG